MGQEWGMKGGGKLRKEREPREDATHGVHLTARPHSNDPPWGHLKCTSGSFTWERNVEKLPITSQLRLKTLHFRLCECGHQVGFHNFPCLNVNKEVPKQKARGLRCRREAGCCHTANVWRGRESTQSGPPLQPLDPETWACLELANSYVCFKNHIRSSFSSRKPFSDRPFLHHSAKLIHLIIHTLTDYPSQEMLHLKVLNSQK